MLLRMYRMKARDGMAAQFEAAASNLARAIGACEGSEQVQLALIGGGEYLFIEQWRDEAARIAAGSAVDASLFGKLFASVEGKPETTDAEILTTL